jgi:phenylalanine-4-hydroxylase
METNYTRISAPEKEKTLQQDYSAYSQEEHQIWEKLFEKHLSAIKGKACQEFIRGLEIMGDLVTRIPEIQKVSKLFEDIVGWKIVPVNKFLPSREYFQHLANKEFPVNIRLRDIAHFDFSNFPDTWHDVFGHLPLVTQPCYSRFLEDISKKWLIANDLQRSQLDNLYWYTVEAGVCKENKQRKAYGAALLSSSADIQYALSDKPKVLPFTLVSVTQSKANPFILQEKLFEIDSFEELNNIKDYLDLVMENEK